MLIMTAHRQLLGSDANGLFQTRWTKAILPALVPLGRHQPNGDIPLGPLAGFEFIRIDEQNFHLRRDGWYLCAEPGRRDLVLDRKTTGEWETFQLVTPDLARAIGESLPDPTAERRRLAARVAQLNQAGEPVKIYAGCGYMPRPDFLNLDIAPHAADFGAQHPDRYFLFPYADQDWQIPDASVDYIFDEDFIEHISQHQQIQFLAETWRVLKPGAYHRVNTPNLISAMRDNSDFRQGIRGVYQGELEFEHIALLSPAGLEELALLVGYRSVVFNAKGAGVSPHAVPDIRPGADRDDVTGNIFADLLK
jgi:hypothetical protein